MAIPHAPSAFISFGIATLVVWRVYSRIRRMVGRQKFSSLRAWLTTCLFPLLMAALLWSALAHTASALALVAGVGVGIGLGVYGLRLTAFEATEAGLYYKPNAHLGIALSLLFVGRMAYRFLQLYLSDLPLNTPPTDFMSSPWTLLIFGTLGGYYVSYAIGLLRWRHRTRGLQNQGVSTPAA